MRRRTMERVQSALRVAGFTQEGEKYAYRSANGGSPFNSWRRDDDNVILTDDTDFADSFLLASKLAKRFNLLDKQDRIALFQAILYGADYSG